MAKQVFRKISLERLSSPEQLDQLITITSPAAWASLLAIGVLLIVAIVWGMYGSIPTKVQGQGILLSQGGVASVQAVASGKITQVQVQVGDLIEKGNVVAQIQQDDLLEQIKQAQLRLNNLETTFREKNKNEAETAMIRLQQLRKDETNLQQHIQNLQIQVNAQQSLKQQQEKLKAGMQSLVDDGVVPRNTVLEIENDIVAIEQQINVLRLEIEKARNEVNDILLAIKTLESSRSAEELQQAQEIEQAQLAIENLQRLYAQNAQITSDYTGKVLEVAVKEGALVRPGDPMLFVEEFSEGGELEAVLYFSPLTGKQIRPGMDVRLSPSTVKQEEYGFMQGVVAHVDEFPSTFQAMMQTLQNQSLAQFLSADIAPIKVVARLQTDAATVSGYAWSSGNGPPVRIGSGTICAAEVTVHEQAPITLVLPILKKFLFGAENPLEQQKE